MVKWYKIAAGLADWQGGMGVCMDMSSKQHDESS